MRALMGENPLEIREDGTLGSPTDQPSAADFAQRRALAMVIILAKALLPDRMIRCVDQHVGVTCDDIEYVPEGELFRQVTVPPGGVLSTSN